jgi:1,6-anhydro-N-acetylmuramate kinase
MLPKAWRWLADYAAAKERWVIGLMSGTSADGVDAVLVRLFGQRPDRVETIAFTTLPYPAAIRDAVLRVSHDGDVATLCWLHFALGELFAEAAQKVAQQGGVPLKRVALIGSHGQTVRHLPPSGRKNRKASWRRKVGTMQLASPAVIAFRTGIPVVSDFRAKDMAAGGQGAPLVPLVDWLLLRHRHKTRLALNIGGIANLTVLPAGASAQKVFAFDTGPGNMPIDGAMRHFTGGAQTCDWDGAWARQGTVQRRLAASTDAPSLFATATAQVNGAGNVRRRVSAESVDASGSVAVDASRCRRHFDGVHGGKHRRRYPAVRRAEGGQSGRSDCQRGRGEQPDAHGDAAGAFGADRRSDAAMNWASTPMPKKPSPLPSWRTERSWA